MATHNVRLVRCKGWEGLYVDGVLKAEAQHITLDEILAVLGVPPVPVVYADPVWLSELGYLPALLVNVKPLES